MNRGKVGLLFIRNLVKNSYNSFCSVDKGSNNLLKFGNHPMRLCSQINSDKNVKIHNSAIIYCDKNNGNISDKCGGKGEIKTCVNDDESKTARLPLNKYEVSKIASKFLLIYTCKKCNTKNNAFISKTAYTKGVVIVTCEGCNARHLIADNLKWFSEENKNIEDMLAAKGESVTKITNSDMYFEAVPSDTSDNETSIESNKTRIS
ncbi:hypothetical protein L9F63_015823 [Diploptera punctata]|uniref:DNL-type domain-containing protein n=1 Tax=Diploptera punctata TaxID=6984 RepID=A0AAD8A4X3_DIPPU|nr:hypothetical protein L9F63_015823 [Diploptera punctata]